MRGESPYRWWAQAKRIAKTPRVATSREIAGARLSGRITRRWIPAPIKAPKPSASIHATGVAVPDSRWL